MRPALRPLTRLDGGGGDTNTSADGDAPRPAPPSTDWTALAVADEDDNDEGSGDDDADAVDADVAASLNALATAAARSMLSDENTRAALGLGSAWRDEVMALGDYCTRAAQRAEKRRQRRSDPAGGPNAAPAPATPAPSASPHMQGALFAFLLLEMADGRWPAQQADALVGPWRAAAERLHGIVEDSGWKLVLPGEEEEEEG